MLGNLFAKFQSFWIAALALVIACYCIIGNYKLSKAKIVAGGFLLLAAFLTSAALYTRAWDCSNSYIETVTDGERVTVWGSLYKKELKDDSYRYYLKDCSFQQDEAITSCNHILIYSDSDVCSIGDSIKLYGTIKLFRTATNEGGFNLRAYYYSQRIDFAVALESVAGVKKASDILGINIREKLYQIRINLSEGLGQIMSEENAGLLSAMLYGEKALLDAETKSLYQASGIAHILAISGLHISLLGMGLYKLLRRLRLPYIIASPLSVVFIILYGNMVGGSVSTSRAVIMLSISLFGQIKGRSNDMLNSLGAVFIYLLVDNPFIIEYSGIWFSVSAILGIAIVGKILPKVYFKDNFDRKKISHRFIEGLIVSLGIQLATVPVVACFYYELPMYSILLNLIVLPMLSVVLSLGLVCSIICRAGLISLAAIIIKPVELILNLYSGLCRLVEKMPCNQLIVGRPSAARMIMYYLVLAIMLRTLWLIMEKEGGRASKAIVTTLGTLAMAILITFPNHFGTEIDFLDVGQGDGIYICTEDERHIFIDGGSSNQKDLAKYTILPFLKYKGVRSINYWFVSHGDEDHVAGLVQAMEEGYQIDNLVMAWASRKDERLGEIVELANNSGIRIIWMKKGDYIELSKSRIECLYPGAGAKNSDANDNCLVIRYSDSNISGIFAGDISGQVEKEIVGSYGSKTRLKADILKANHHGSNYSNSEVWLDSIKPEIVVISCALRNNYGHPGKEAVKRLKNRSIDVKYTMYQGQVKIIRR